MIDLYFEWLIRFVDCVDHPVMEYYDVLRAIYNTKFQWVIPRDGNRASDGMALRQRYIDEENPVRDKHFVNVVSQPCSVLEMMVALSIRCEFDYMHDAEFGDRTPCWFWVMMEHIGLDKLKNSEFSMDKFQRISGPLFVPTFKIWPTFFGPQGYWPVVRDGFDPQKSEIWDQMNQFLDKFNDFGPLCPDLNPFY